MKSTRVRRNGRFIVPLLPGYKKKKKRDVITKAVVLLAAIIAAYN